jgi:hypothetical protein
MSLLAPEADRAVRDAVEAFMAGALRPSMLGETMFETKNSRYRLMDGVLFSSSDSTMVGAELVGWLLEGPEQSVVQDGWVAGARGVLVDRKKSRNIIVTSTSRLFRVDASDSSCSRSARAPTRSGSGLKPIPEAPAGSIRNQGYRAEAQQSYSPPPPIPASPTPSSHRGPPTHRRPIPPCPPAPIGRLPGTTELSVATAMISREPSQPGAPLPLPPPTPRPSPPELRASAPQHGQRAPVHAPPRLTGRHPRVSLPSLPPLSPPPGLRPLPLPTPPPSRRPVQAMREIEVEEDPTGKHDRSLLPLPAPTSVPRPARSEAAPASGIRRGSSPTLLPRKASRRVITFS